MDEDSEAAAAWLEGFFGPLFFDAKTCLTTDPAHVALTPADSPLVPVVAVGSGAPRVSAKGLILAPFHLPRLLNDPTHGPPALAAVDALAEQIRSRLRAAHGERAVLRHLIWAGMGGSIEDKNAALGARLLAEPDSPGLAASGLAAQPRLELWTLDDVNADSLAHILAAIGAEARARGAEHAAGAAGAVDGFLAAGLRETVVVAQALGMTSFEPAFVVQAALGPLFARCGLPLEAHFCKVTIPGSILDATLASPPVVALPHQPGPAGGQFSAAGRHDFVTHGMLLPLALGRAPLEPYVRGLRLAPAQAAAALRIAAWIDRGGSVRSAGPRKEALVLRLPAEWCGRWHARAAGGEAEWRDASLWFKQILEESLGKTPAIRLKVVTAPEAPTDPSTQLVLLVRPPAAPAAAGEGGEDDEAALAAQGYDVLSYALPPEAELAAGPPASVGAVRPAAGVSAVGAAGGGGGLTVGGARVGELGPASLAHACSLFCALSYRLAQLWGLCAVDQPPVESYKRIVAHVEADARARDAARRLLGLGGPAVRGGPASEPPMALTVEGPAGMRLCLSAAHLGGGLHTAAVAAELGALGLDASSLADVLGAAHRVAARELRRPVDTDGEPRLSYGEAIYFGNLTRGACARAMRRLLDEAFAHELWARALRSFADVGKGPGVGHATHAMSKQGGALTLSILPEDAEPDDEAAPDDECAAEPGAAAALRGGLAAARAQLAGFPAAYQASHAYANVLALAGFDVDEARAEIIPGAAHPGAVLLLTIRRNDAATRGALARALARAAEIVRMP